MGEGIAASLINRRRLLGHKQSHKILRTLFSTVKKLHKALFPVQAILIHPLPAPPHTFLYLALTRFSVAYLLTLVSHGACVAKFIKFSYFVCKPYVSVSISVS